MRRAGHNLKSGLWRSATIVLLSMLVLLPGVSRAGVGQDLTAEYEWDFVKIGGFTWFTNVWVHPGGNGPIYNNSDTAIPYRWDAANNKWIPIVTGQSMPNPDGFLLNYDYATTGEESSRPGPNALAIAGAPSDPNVAYFAYQDNLAGADLGNIYRSANKGDTWTLPGRLDVYVGPNSHDDARTSGPRIAVDPADANVVYFGSQRNGLFRSTDGAATWTQITAVPTPANKGSTVVLIDPNSGATGGRTNTIYACPAGSGVYRSNDGGTTWAGIGGPMEALHGQIGPDRTLYISTGSAIHKYANGTWTNISPGTVYDVAVDPFNGNRLVAVNRHSETYLSANQGASWTKLPFTVNYGGIAAHAQRTGGVDRLTIQFDTGVQNKLWAAEAYGLWTLDITSGTAAWTSVSHGTEGYASHAIRKVPGGGVLTGQMDGGVYYHSDPGQYTSVQVANPTSEWHYQHGWSVDYCVAQPNFVAAINGPPHTWSIEHSGYSTDYGKPGTWVKFKSAPAYKATTPAGIAISATNPDHMCVLDSSQGSVYFTTNRGDRWSKKGFGGSVLTTWWGPGEGGVTADKVQGGTFYFYNWSDGSIWRTTNTGGDFAKVGLIPGGANYSDIEATPYRAGHVWFCDGQPLGGDDKAGLLRSTDFGSTWSYVPGVDLAKSIGFGKPAVEGGYPTIFLYGTVGRVEGVFRSTDEGVTWDKIAAIAPLGLYCGSNSMSGDLEVFGRVYVNISGIGSAWGDSGGGGQPVANNDGYSINANTLLSVAIPGVLGNDTDSDGDSLTAQLVTNVSNGALTLNSNGSFSYAPNSGFIGEDSFTYKASDGTQTSGSATVTINVTGTGTSMHVAQIANVRKTTGQSTGCVADVQIVDNHGFPVKDATVWGNVNGGGCSATGKAVTNADGWCTVQITGVCKQVVCNFCVDNVTHATLTYNASANVETCE